MTYSEFYNELLCYAEEEYAAFQRKLIPTERKILGVRTPIMRKIAKKYTAEIDSLFSFPDDCYETVFIRLTVASMLPYEEFLKYLEKCVSQMDNWALSDCFKPKCLKKYRDDFLPELEKLFSDGKEFYQRYVLVVLLSEYVEQKYLPLIENYLKRADTQPYYVHMAAAWLTAEVLIKEYNYGVEILKKGLLERKTHNKAIQKAIESYRLTQEQKEFLRSLKIK